MLTTHNPANPIQLSLGSGGGYSVWEIPVSAFNSSTFTEVLVSIATTPVYTQGSLDLTAVTNFQVQGNWSNTANFDIEVEYMAIITRTPSSGCSNAASVGVGCCVLEKEVAQ